jgi:hypothetical protein
MVFEYGSLQMDQSLPILLQAALALIRVPGVFLVPISTSLIAAIVNLVSDAGQYTTRSDAYHRKDSHSITFDITLCGSLAGTTYAQSGCQAQYPACSFQVGYNGSSFNQSYWSIYDLRVFASGGGTDNAANSPNTHSEAFGSSAARLYTTSSILAIVVLIACFTVSI